MNKLLILQYIYEKLYFIIIFICLISCTNYEKEANDIFFQSEYSNEVPDIDFTTIDSLNESNQKAIILPSFVGLKKFIPLNQFSLLAKNADDTQPVWTKIETHLNDEDFHTAFSGCKFIFLHVDPPVVLIILIMVFLGDCQFLHEDPPVNVFE